MPVTKTSKPIHLTEETFRTIFREEKQDIMDAIYGNTKLIMGVRDELISRIERSHTDLVERIEAVDSKADFLAASTKRQFDRVDKRFEGIDQRFKKIDNQFEAMNKKFTKQFGKVNKRLDSIEKKM